MSRSLRLRPSELSEGDRRADFVLKAVRRSHDGRSGRLWGRKARGLAMYVYPVLQCS